ncbi:MAG: F0F1 ATP synthase subunit A [Myxococcales bacterium]|nr:F0F1 ATP synthase subunit A [Myxococcales bacterium]
MIFQTIASSEHFSLFTYFLKMNPGYVHVAMSAVVTLLVTWLSLSIHRSFKRDQDNKRDPLIPDDKLSVRNIVEIGLERLFQMFQNILGHDAEKHFGLLASIFLYILISNFLGMIPGFLPPSDNMNTNLAIGLVVFLYYNYQGYKEHGKGYIKHFMGPVWWLAPLMFVIEMISHIVRPVSLSLRLAGNMTGDHQVLGVFSNMTPLLIPIVFMALGFLVCFLQAFVFTLLSSVYIAMAVSHDH